MHLWMLGTRVCCDDATFHTVVCLSSRQANVVQRVGRAGRVQDGMCVHLFTQARFQRLAKEPTPEMQRVSLEEVVLSVCDLGLDDTKDVLWTAGADAGVCKFLAGAPDPPDEKAVAYAFFELQRIGALDDHGWITHLGALLARPLSGRFGLSAGWRHGSPSVFVDRMLPGGIRGPGEGWARAEVEGRSRVAARTPIVLDGRASTPKVQAVAFRCGAVFGRGCITCPGCSAGGYLPQTIHGDAIVCVRAEDCSISSSSRSRT